MSDQFWLDGKVLRKGKEYVGEFAAYEPLLLRELLTDKQAQKAQPQAAQAVPVDAVALAYGILWHANNMRPGYDAPAGHERLTPEKAAYKARHVLRDLLTRDQLGDGINRASDLLAASQREGGGT